MKFQISNFKFQVIRLLLSAPESLRLSGVPICCSAALLLFFSLQPSAFGSEKWPGVDESVIEKYAKEHGRESREPFINTDQGDLLLFVFLLAGAVGGFAAGYYWRTLTEVRSRKPEVRMQSASGGTKNR